MGTAYLLSSKVRRGSRYCNVRGGTPTSADVEFAREHIFSMLSSVNQLGVNSDFYKDRIKPFTDKVKEARGNGFVCDSVKYCIGTNKVESVQERKWLKTMINHELGVAIGDDAQIPCTDTNHDIWQ